MASISPSPISPEDFEKMPADPERHPSSQRPSCSSSDSDWYLNKRGSDSRSRGNSTSESSSSIIISESSTKPPRDDKLTPLPASMEVSLAILTSGLSVAAFHAVRSISERRAAKKQKAAETQQAELSRKESLLVPSSIPEQTSGPMELEAEPVTEQVMELEGSPVESPPAYSADTVKPAP